MSKQGSTLWHLIGSAACNEDEELDSSLLSEVHRLTAADEDGILEASDILTCVVKRYTTIVVDDLVSLAPTHVPLIVEQLC